MNDHLSPVYFAFPVAERLMKRAEVEAVVGLARSTLYRLIAKGLFPKPRRLNGPNGAARWVQSEVESWVKAQAASA